MSEPPKIRVLIVDDHAVVRKGLRRLLEDTPDIEVVDDLEFGEDGIRAVAELAPDVVLLDLMLETSQIDGIDTLKQIVSTSPSTHVVVLSVVDDEATVFPAICAGAIGYMLKNSMPEEVIEAIRDAARNRYHMDPLITRKIVQRLQEEEKATGNPDPEKKLTAREKEILPLLARGLTNQQIANVLVISASTVKTHVSNILRKLDVPDRTRIALKLSIQGKPIA